MEEYDCIVGHGQGGRGGRAARPVLRPDLSHYIPWSQTTSAALQLVPQAGATGLVATDVMSL